MALTICPDRAPVARYHRADRQCHSASGCVSARHKSPSAPKDSWSAGEFPQPDREQSSRRDIRPGISYFGLHNSFGREFVRENTHAFQQGVSPLSFILVHHADGEPHMHHYVVAFLRFGYEIETGLASDATKQNAPQAYAIFLFDLGHLTRYSQAHNP